MKATQRTSYPGKGTKIAGGIAGNKKLKVSGALDGKKKVKYSGAIDEDTDANEGGKD